VSKDAAAGIDVLACQPDPSELWKTGEDKRAGLRRHLTDHELM
jgi:hypothetical protein